MQVIVDGLVTNYQRRGRGPVVVMLHGWADRAATFNGLAESLGQNYQVLALDLPGFGGTQRPDKPWHTDNFSNFVADWLEKIDAGDIYAFIGHSFGAAVAINGLANGQLDCKKLVLMAAAGIRDKDSAKKTALKLFAKTTKIGLYFLPTGTRQKLRQKAYGKLGSDMLALAEMEPSFRLIIEEDMQAQAKKLKMPTLLVFGSDDDQTPVADGEIFKNDINHSRLEVIDGAGHFVHQDKAAQVGKLVKDFLA